MSDNDERTVGSNIDKNPLENKYILIKIMGVLYRYISYSILPLPVMLCLPLFTSFYEKLMPSMFTVVSWLPVPLVSQVTGPRATTVNIALTVVYIGCPIIMLFVLVIIIR